MILGVESSCDESALSLFDEKQGVVGEWLNSQISLHCEYGGVVPDLASREHLRNFSPLLELLEREVAYSDVSLIAVTRGPGLAACLALGIAFAKSLSVAWGVPLCGVNHLKAHAYSPFIALHKRDPVQFHGLFERALPHLGLIVSGGNTLLFEINRKHAITIIAQTVDDASGEALDKGAKLLGLEYPGGPLIEKAAEDGDPKAFDFPKAFPQRSEMKFSFSGLKTSLRYRLEKMSADELTNVFPDLCASYQEAVIGQLINKVKHALESKEYMSLGLSGGVSNNKRLRMAFESLADNRGVPSYVAEVGHTGDNAAMVAFFAWMNEVNTLRDSSFKLTFDSSLALT